MQSDRTALYDGPIRCVLLNAARPRRTGKQARARAHTFAAQGPHAPCAADAAQETGACACHSAAWLRDARTERHSGTPCACLGGESIHHTASVTQLGSLAGVVRYARRVPTLRRVFTPVLVSNAVPAPRGSAVTQLVVPRATAHPAHAFIRTLSVVAYLARLLFAEFRRLLLPCASAAACPVCLLRAAPAQVRAPVTPTALRHGPYSAVCAWRWLSQPHALRRSAGRRPRAARQRPARRRGDAAHRC